MQKLEIRKQALHRKQCSNQALLNMKNPNKKWVNLLSNPRSDGVTTKLAAFSSE
jgi:hypothetical protein